MQKCYPPIFFVVFRLAKCRNVFLSTAVPMGGVKNLQVIDPTISTLTVRWEPAVGNVREYKVFYAAQPGGEELTVGL